MVSWQEQLEQNQQTIRYANGRFQAVVEENAFGGLRTVPFLCECADLDCRGRIEITTGDYDAAHLGSDYYVILPGHLTIDGEGVVEDNVSYLVMDKDRS